MSDDRPVECCGKCPPILGGGYDCTCEGNPRCSKYGMTIPCMSCGHPRDDTAPSQCLAPHNHYVLKKKEEA